MKISIFKNLFKSKDVPYKISLEKCLERIRTGKSKDLVDQIRQGFTEKKKDLPCIIFSGEFNERKKDGLIKHSGMMVTDFDKFPDKETMNEYMELLKSNPHFITLFVSPSGNGIKGVVKIPPCNAKDHERYFKEFNSQFNYDYFDASNCNVDRVCFESYDPDIYINDNAELYAPELIDQGFAVHEKVPLLPISDEGKIINLIMSFKWNIEFVSGQRNNFILAVAGAFCEYGVSELTTVNYLASRYCTSDDFTVRELEKTVKNAFRLRTPNTKFFEDYDTIKSIKSDLKKGKEAVKEKYKINDSVYEDIKEDHFNDDFWIIIEDRNGNTKVQIEPLKFKHFLERNGFKKFFPEGALKPTFVKVESNKVQETSPEMIKDFVLNYLSEKKEFDVWNYTAKFGNLFSEQFLLMLDTVELMMLKDTKLKSFVAYRNGILEVTKDGSELIDYIDVDGYIWNRQIIQRDFIFSEDTENDYQQFIENISGNRSLPLECVIGYLLSTYKNKTNNKAIILNDEVISENPEGGTGKGLFIQGIKNIRRTSILDGKAFDDKKSFPYQTVTQDTQILVFDDVKKNFNFESKFSLVTEGLTLERKNKDAIKLSVEESPKLVISTNYAIKGEGNSHARRRHEIELTQYYNGERTPFDEFQRQVFDDWNDSDWIRFDNYMMNCLSLYLSEGLVKQTAKNIKLRKLIAESSMEFWEWCSDENNLPRNTRNDKSRYFVDFTEEYQDFKRWLTRKKFNIWLKKYAKFEGCSFEEGNTNGQRWFKIKHEECSN